MADNWRDNILLDPVAIQHLLSNIRRVAVLGIRSEKHPDRPAHYVPAALQRMGLDIVPVPTAERDVDTILGQQVYRRLKDVEGPVDIVDVFRKSEDIPGHLEDLLAAAPNVVWFQSGIRNDEVAETLARAGIKVVQSRCLMIDYQSLGPAVSAKSTLG